MNKELSYSALEELLGNEQKVYLENGEDFVVRGSDNWFVVNICSQIAYGESSKTCVFLMYWASGIVDIEIRYHAPRAIYRARDYVGNKDRKGELWRR